MFCLSILALEKVGIYKREISMNLDELIHQSIAERAYQLYQKRGYGPGRELDDWLQAQSDVLAKAFLTGISLERDSTCSSLIKKQS
jgi:hypothetical protein